MIYLMSKTQEVFAQSSEPQAHVKNARQTKTTKNKIKCELCMYKYKNPNYQVHRNLGKMF